MSISVQLYNQLKQNYGKYASWAIWDAYDITVPPTVNDINKMRTDIVFVALNATALTNTWEAFHVKEKYDRVFSDIVKESDVCGAYCTDLFKGPVNNVLDPNSNNVGKYMKNHDCEFNTKCAAFFNELQSLGKVETVFVFGNVAFKLILKYLEDKGIIPRIPNKAKCNTITAKGYTFVKLTHYSYRWPGKDAKMKDNVDTIKKYYP